MTVNLREIQPPTAEPVSLEEARQHLREDFDPDDEFDQDVVLPIYIQAAREHAESTTERLLTDALMEWRLDGLEDEVRLPVAGVGSVESIHYVDAIGSSQTLDPAVYVFDDNPDSPTIRLRYGQAWPAVRSEANAVRVLFRGRYSTSDSPPAPIPKAIKLAMLLLIGHWYENREEVVIGAPATNVPTAAAALLSMQRTNLGV